MIKIGDKIPNIGFKIMGKNGPDAISSDELFSNKKIVIFSLPGAFTPTCSAKHLPEFVENADKIKGMGVDSIACISVNDAFVMGAWGKDQNTGDKIMMLADGSAEWVDAIGLGLDLTAAGMGKRGQRFAMIIDNGIVSHLAVDEHGEFEVSSAEAIIKVLG